MDNEIALLQTNELARVTSAVVTALAVLLLVIMYQKNRTGQTVKVWLCSGLAGVLAGAAGFFGVLHYSGHVIEKVAAASAAGGNQNSTASAGAGSKGGGPGGGMMMGGPGGPPGGGMMMGGPGGGGKGGGSKGGGGGFGGGAPSPKATLTGLVRKLELLTGDVAIKLTDEQKQALGKELAGLETEKTMSDEQAQAKLDAINKLLDDSQKATHQKIALPRVGGGGFGGPPPDPTANPFSETNSLNALKTFRTRL